MLYMSNVFVCLRVNSICLFISFVYAAQATDLIKSALRLH